ncbi:MAG TPA: 16S rRNA (adenine(1518)-N(6)/adenine(1519)-N(6))-dimethyltransferase RsmA [Thermomicrobiales bacterium]|nr:16S rRNA (adenine(1518)-N(6)/adenine(1519)-N(6))-dimethyltransferase RsmA [Thermomicrobiales bacterium]
MTAPLSSDPIDQLPTSRRAWLALLAERGIRPSKGLGQHFLYERGVVQRMVKQAGVGPNDTVLEIGPGLGILTSELLRKAGRVVAVELDRQLAAHLRQEFAGEPRLTVIEGDALALPIDDLIPPGAEFVVVANLPYSVGSAVLRHLLEQPRRPRRLTVMLQREVAERLGAKPPDMSVLSVATQLFAEARIAFAVAPSVFIPPPTVDSAVAILDVRPEPLLSAAEQPRFFRIVNAGFRQKRKQVANSLAAELDVPKAVVQAWLDGAGIDPIRRAQTLSVEDWVRLTRAAPPDIAA